MNITKGKKTRPQRVVLYAPEGIGKSTLASQIDAPLFFDFERGTHHLDVARVEPATLREAETMLGSLVDDQQGFRSVVIDTIDWLEELVIEDICTTAKKASIEDFGYGKGYVVLGERFTGLLNLLNRVAEKMHVVLLAHAHVRKFELPDSAGAFDRYELKLTKHVAPLVKEWADALLFGNWKTILKERENDTFKATSNSGRERRLYCSHTSAWDAKSRVAVKDEEPWSLETLLKFLPPACADGKKIPAPPSPQRDGADAQARATIPPLPAVTAERPAPASDSRELSGAGLATSDGIPGLAPENGGPRPLSGVYHQTCDGIGTQTVTDFLRARKVVASDQTWRDVSEAYERKVCANPAGFVTAVSTWEANK